MHVEELNWDDFKTNVTDRKIELQYFLKNNTYHILGFDGKIKFSCKIDVDDPRSQDQIDFEDNYKPISNHRLNSVDPRTEGLRISPKIAPTGWVQRIHEIDFVTSTLNSFHDKDYLDIDFGWTTMKFFEGNAPYEVEITGSNLNQTYLNNNCTRTDLYFMPNKDIMLLSAGLTQLQAKPDNVYLWGLILFLDAPYNTSITPIELVEGGVNLKYLADKGSVVMKGRAPAVLYHNGVISPNGLDKIALPAGIGSNRLTYILRHPVGFKNYYQTIIEYFSG